MKNLRNRNPQLQNLRHHHNKYYKEMNAEDDITKIIPKTHFITLKSTIAKNSAKDQ